MKIIGKLHGVDFYESPYVPRNTTVMLNDKYYTFSVVKKTRWQRLKAFLRHPFKHKSPF